MKNGLAVSLKILGFFVFGCGIFLSFTERDFDLFFIIAGTITAVFIQGFAEVISLLQQSVNKQNEILEVLQKKQDGNRVISKTVLQDIEDNLPDM